MTSYRAAWDHEVRMWPDRFEAVLRGDKRAFCGTSPEYKKNDLVLIKEFESGKEDAAEDLAKFHSQEIAGEEVTAEGACTGRGAVVQISDIADLGDGKFCFSIVPALSVESE